MVVAQMGTAADWQSEYQAQQQVAQTPCEGCQMLMLSVSQQEEPSPLRKNACCTYISGAQEM